VTAPPQHSVNFDRHVRWGWWLLFWFVALGVALEVQHGLKLGFLLDLSNETRRLMWRLAHAHGTLVGLLHLSFAGCAQRWNAHSKRLAWASRCLTIASVLLPLGFFLGGIIVYEGDPWIGVLLVPAGALLLTIAMLLVALEAGKRSDVN
jgi:hypothetical protein